MSLVARGWVSLGVLVLVLVTGMAQPAGAQPGSGPYFKIHLGQPAGGTITKVNGEVTVYLNFTVKSDNPQANALENQFIILVNVTRTFPIQNGWSAGVLEISPPSGQIRPGDPVEVKMRVYNTMPDPDGDKVDVTFNVRSKPVFQGAPGPLTDALVQQMSQEDRKSARATVDRELDFYERVTGLAKAQPVLFIVMAGGVFVLAVVLIRRKKGGVTVSSDGPVQQLVPGRGASFPVKVANQGGSKQNLTLGTSDVPPGWSAILPVDRIELEGNESTTIWLTVKAPQNAHPGEHVQLNFIATGADGASSETLLEASVVESYGPESAQRTQEEAPVAAPRPSPRRRR